MAREIIYLKRKIKHKRRRFVASCSIPPTPWNRTDDLGLRLSCKQIFDVARCMRRVRHLLFVSNMTCARPFPGACTLRCCRFVHFTLVCWAILELFWCLLDIKQCRERNLEPEWQRWIAHDRRGGTQAQPAAQSAEKSSSRIGRIHKVPASNPAIFAKQNVGSAFQSLSSKICTGGLCENRQVVSVRANDHVYLPLGCCSTDYLGCAELRWHACRTKSSSIEWTVHYIDRSVHLRIKFYFLRSRVQN